MAAVSCLPPVPPEAGSLLKADLSRTRPELPSLGHEEGEERFPLVRGQRGGGDSTGKDPEAGKHKDYLGIREEV